jgi:hypothetical protein
LFVVSFGNYDSSGIAASRLIPRGLQPHILIF